MPDVSIWLYISSILLILLLISVHRSINLNETEQPLFSKGDSFIGTKKPFWQVSFEEVQLYWDTRPCNIGHSIAELGSIEYFNDVEKRKYFVEPHIPIFAEFQRWRGKRILEIGCGL